MGGLREGFPVGKVANDPGLVASTMRCPTPALKPHVEGHGIHVKYINLLLGSA
jgi:hypothetical protein